MTVIERTVEQPRSGTDYPRLGLLSAGHFINDMYGNFLTALTPYLVLSGAISATFAGFVLLIYLFGSSALQPVFGVFSDRSGRRMYAVIGPIWIGAMASLFGWGGGELALFGFALLGGIGTAAFHPQAASMVDGISPHGKGWAMAIFSVGGNIGFAIGPVLAATIAGVGLHWSPIILIPGIIVTALLALYAPGVKTSSSEFNLSDLKQIVTSQWRPLSLVVAVIAIRGAAQFALIIFLPLYYHARGLPAEDGSYVAFALSFSGAFGGLLGGHLSDIYGRRLVVTLSLLLAAPLIFLTLEASGAIVWPIVILAGAALLASNSATVVQGQELMPNNTGIASGLTLGFAFGLSGFITSGLTGLTDQISVTIIIFSAPLFALIAGGIAAFTPETGAARRARSAL